MIKIFHQQNDEKLEDYIEKLSRHFGPNPNKDDIISNIWKC
jgi:hypothetical protein